MLTEGRLTRLFVRESGRIVPVPLVAIERFQACDDLEARLDQQAFVRVHRSSMVNLDHVISMEPYDGSRIQITLRSGTTLMASRQRSRLLRAISR